MNAHADERVAHTGENPAVLRLLGQKTLNPRRPIGMGIGQRSAIDDHRQSAGHTSSGADRGQGRREDVHLHHGGLARPGRRGDLLGPAASVHQMLE